MNKIVKQTAAVLLACTMMSGVIPANVTGGIFSTSITASALSGYGTIANPYVVDSYDELRELISPADEYKHMYEYNKHIYVKLGSDIIEDDTADGRYFDIYSHLEYYRHTLHLDLAGHKLSRTANTKDNCLFSIRNCSVIIDDSVGGGIISCNYENSQTYLFNVTDTAELIINGGTFELLTNNKNDTCINNYAGNVIINGGTFKSFKDLVTTNYISLCYTKINGGTFIYKGKTDTSDKPNYGIEVDYIKNCTVIGEQSDAFIYSREEKPKYIKNIIPAQAVVSIDGEVVAHDDLSTDYTSVEIKESMINGREITISSPAEVEAVNMNITAPKADEGPKDEAVVSGEGFKEYTIRTETVNGRHRFKSVENTIDWYHGDTKMRARSKFKEGETYTAKFYLKSDDEHILTADTKVFVNDVRAQTTDTDFSGAVLYTVDFVCKADYTEPEDLGELVVDITKGGHMGHDYYPRGLSSMGERAAIGYSYEEDFDWYDLDNDGYSDVCYSKEGHSFEAYGEVTKNEITVTFDEEAVREERKGARTKNKAGYYSSMRFIFNKDIKWEALDNFVVDLSEDAIKDSMYYTEGLRNMGERGLIGYRLDYDFSWYDLDKDGLYDIRFNEKDYSLDNYILDPKKADITVAFDDEAIQAQKQYALKNDLSFYYTSLTFKFNKTAYLHGDVNGDGVINVTDITKTAAHVKGKKLLTGDALTRADVNNDGVVNVTDITKIAAHVKGKKLLTGSK